MVAEGKLKRISFDAEDSENSTMDTMIHVWESFGIVAKTKLILTVVIWVN